METLNFMLEKQKKVLIKRMKAKLICTETFDMLKSVNSIIEEHGKERNLDSYLENSLSTIQEIIYGVFKEKLEIKKEIKLENENEKVTITTVSYDGIEIAALEARPVK